MENNRQTFLLKSLGFTLVELLVVVAMLASLFTLLLFIVNPLNQINKVKDATRQHDLATIKTALDAYYNDHGCYPLLLTFGNSFSQSNNIYMKLVPNDPDTTTTAYVYQTDGTSCPQWNVLYAKLKSNAIDVEGKTLCALNSRSNCVPLNYTALKYNYCAISGDVNCSYVSTSSLIPSTSNYGSGGSGSAPTPTPIPNGCSKNYKCTGGPPAMCDVVSPAGTGDYCGYGGCGSVRDAQGNLACCNFACP